MAREKTLLEKIQGLIWYDLLTQLKDILLALYEAFTGSVQSIQQGTNVTITGTGTVEDPFIINASGGGGGGGNLQEITDNGNTTTNPIIINTSSIGDFQTRLFGDLMDMTDLGTEEQVFANPTTIGFSQQANTNPVTKTISPGAIAETGQNYELPDKPSGNYLLATVEVESNYENDSAAATGGIRVGYLYHTSGVVKVRLT